MAVLGHPGARPELSPPPFAQISPLAAHEAVGGVGWFVERIEPLLSRKPRRFRYPGRKH